LLGNRFHAFFESVLPESFRHGMSHVFLLFSVRRIGLGVTTLSCLSVEVVNYAMLVIACDT
jgi:hypothetical protein